MKKSIFSAAIILLFCLLLTSCGKQATNGPTGSTTYSDLACESQSLYNVTGSKYAHCLGTQYWQGEPIQLWSDVDASGRQSEIYAYKSDGSRELLFEGLDRNLYLSGDGYLDSEGNLYFWRLGPLIYKTSPSGEQLYTSDFSELALTYIEDICQTSDGRIFVLCAKEETGKRSLGEVDPDTGTITIIKNINRQSWIGAGEEKLFLADLYGLWKVDTEDGSEERQLSFAGTTYTLIKAEGDARIQDFQVKENQGMEILRTDFFGGKWKQETVRQMVIDVGKTVLTLRGSFANETWLKGQVNDFNLSDNDFYVVLEDIDNYIDREECARLSSVEIATGKGPDLFYGDVLGKYLYGVIQKGGLEDLAPYIKKSSIKEKDYFPATFGRWRDGKKIYGVSISLSGMFYCVDSAILGTDREPDIETFVGTLLSLEGQYRYYLNRDASEVLRMLLEGSENLWGMINWKKGTCDFGGELFSGILEAARRYGDDGRKLSPTLLDFTGLGVYNYQDPENLKKRGIVKVGVLFDDGIHGVAREYCPTLAINVNSANKQGAWEFVQFLLGKEAQSEAGTSSQWPVNKSVCQVYLEELLETSQQRETETLHKLTETRIDYLMEELEELRFLPMRTEPILDIICDEAENYFNGTKSIDQIIPVIQNRVKLYLEETGS